MCVVSLLKLPTLATSKPTYITLGEPWQTVFPVARRRLHPICSTHNRASCETTFPKNAPKASPLGLLGPILPMRPCFISIRVCLPVWSLRRLDSKQPENPSRSGELDYDRPPHRRRQHRRRRA